MNPRTDSTSSPISWPTTLFLLTTTCLTLAWPLYAWRFGVTAGEVALAVGYFVACGLAITAGYHRLLSHRAYACRTWLKALYLIVGAAAWQGSALEWGADHIRHHAHTDTPKDPYNIRQGVWHAHVGWLLRKQKPSSVPPYLANDRLVALQHRFYVPLAVVVGFIVPFAVAGVGGFLLAGVVRTVVGHHVTWLINSWAHMGSRRPFEPGVSAADNWLLAFFTFGEGWHNYHHAFPSDYRNGIRPFDWDPSKWLIWTLSLVGVTYDLKRVAPALQWRRRVRSAIATARSQARGVDTLRRTRAALEAQIRRTRDRLERASRRRAAHFGELVESLRVYQELLEQLLSHERMLAGAAA